MIPSATRTVKTGVARKIDLCIRSVMNLLHRVGQVQDIEEDVSPGNTRQASEEEATGEGSPAVSRLHTAHGTEPQPFTSNSSPGIDKQNNG